MSFHDFGRRVLEIQVIAHLGDRTPYFDVPGVVNGIVDRLGFVDLDEIDPLVFEEILDQHRNTL